MRVRFSNEGIGKQATRIKSERNTKLWNDENDSRRREIDLRLMNANKSPVVSGRSFSLGRKPENHKEALNMLESVLSESAVAEGSVD